MRNPTHRHHRKKICEATDHFKYPTIIDACRALADLTLNTDRKGHAQMLSAYRCKECREYHVGHTPIETVRRFGLGAEAGSKPASQSTR